MAMTDIEGAVSYIDDNTRWRCHVTVTWQRHQGDAATSQWRGSVLVITWWNGLAVPKNSWINMRCADLSIRHASTMSVHNRPSHMLHVVIHNITYATSPTYDVLVCKCFLYIGMIITSRSTKIVGFLHVFMTLTLSRNLITFVFHRQGSWLSVDGSSADVWQICFLKSACFWFVTRNVTSFITVTHLTVASHIGYASLHFGPTNEVAAHLLSLDSPLFHEKLCNCAYHSCTIVIKI